MSNYTEERFIKASESESLKLIAEGHDPGEWTWSEFLKSYKTTCRKCHGTVDLSPPKLYQAECDYLT